MQRRAEPVAALHAQWSDGRFANGARACHRVPHARGNRADRIQPGRECDFEIPRRTGCATDGAGRGRAVLSAPAVAGVATDSLGRLSVGHADAVVLFTSVPTKLINISVFDYC